MEGRRALRVGAADVHNTCFGLGMCMAFWVHFFLCDIAGLYTYGLGSGVVSVSLFLDPRV